MGGRTDTRAAASSIASGKPSSCRQIFGHRCRVGRGELEVRVGRTCARHEEVDRRRTGQRIRFRLVNGRQRERLHDEAVLARQAQRDTRRDQHGDAAGRGRQLREEAPFGRDPVEVVQHQKELGGRQTYGDGVLEQADLLCRRCRSLARSPRPTPGDRPRTRAAPTPRRVGSRRPLRSPSPLPAVSCRRRPVRSTTPGGRRAGTAAFAARRPRRPCRPSR